MKRVLLSVCVALVMPVIGMAQQDPDPHPEVEKILDRALAAKGAEKTKLLAEALDKSIKLKDTVGEAVTYLLTAGEAQLQGDLEGSLKNFSKAAAAAQRAKARMCEGLARNALGTIYLSLGKMGEARIEFDRGLEALGATNEDLQALLLNGAAFSRANLGAFQAALPLYRRSLALARKHDLGSHLSAVLNNAAMTLTTLGERSEAIEMLKEAMKIAEESKDDNLIARTANNFGMVYQVLADWVTAEGFLLRALEVSKRSKNVQVEAIALSNLALNYSGLGDYRKSLKFNEDATILFREMGDWNMVPILLNNKGMAHMFLSEPEAAKRALEDALGILQKGANRHSEAFLLMNLGTLEWILERIDPARLRFQQALPLAMQSGDVQVSANTLALLAATYQQSDPNFAIALLKESVNRFQLLRLDVQKQEERTRAAFKEYVDGAYQGLADLLVRQGRLAEAQQVLDLLKEDEFVQFIRRKGEGSSKATLTEAEKTFESRYAEIASKVGQVGEEYSRLLARERDGTATDDERTRAKKLGADLEVVRLQFTRFLQDAARDFKDATAKQSAVEDIQNTARLKKSLRTISDKTGRRTVAVYTVSAEDRLHLILVTPELQDVATVKVSQEDLRVKVFEFRSIVQRSDLDPRPKGKELFDLIVAPILSKVGEGEVDVLWSLDGALRYLPIGALWDGSRYAIETHSHTVITPAGQSDLVADPEKWSVLAFGASKPATIPGIGREVKFPGLPGVVREIEDIGKACPTLPFFDDAFSKDKFFEEVRLGKHSVLHIATHFHFEAGQDDASFLLLGSGVALPFSEISAKMDSGLFEGIEMLTLSACETAVSSQANGRDFEGMAALAQRAGVRSVLASLWPVSDGSTRALMGRFYANRGASPASTKADALRRAQLAMLRGELKGAPDDVRAGSTAGQKEIYGAPPYPSGLPEWSHPRYWAPFVLLGNPR